MTQNNIRDFLSSGAFLRLSNGKICLWQGTYKTGDLIKKEAVDVAYQSFFDREPNPLKFDQEMQLVDVPKLRSYLMQFIGEESSSLRKEHFSEPSLAAYEKTFQVIQGKIQRGEIEKAVPIVSASSKIVPSLIDRACMLNNLLEAHENLHVYGFWNGEEGILGATPEILFTKQDKAIRSVAMAGTCPRADLGLRIPLDKDPKELKEHEFVIRDIKAVLEKWGWVRVNPTKILELPTLLHLATWIEVESSTAQPVDLIKAMHPTAALGVSPRNYGLAWMKSMDGQESRRWFGAPLLFKVDAKKDSWVCLVAIRNLQWNKTGSWINSGAGLVASSELHREWRELEAKRESIFKMLGI